MDNEQTLWFSTGKGLAKLDRQNQNFYTVATSERRISAQDNSEQLADVIIRKVFLAKDGRLWLSTQKQGSYIFEPKTGKTTALALENPDNPKINTSIVQPTKEEIWISGSSGIEVRDASTGELKKVLTANSLDEYGLQSNTVWGMATSKQGLVWLGVKNFGLQYYNANNEFVKHLDVYQPQFAPLFDNSIVSASLDKNKNLVLTTTDKVLLLDFIKGNITPFIKDPHFESFIGNGLLAYDDQRFFIGSENGSILEYNTKSQKGKLIELPIEWQKGVHVKFIVKGSNNHISWADWTQVSEPINVSESPTLALLLLSLIAFGVRKLRKA